MKLHFALILFLLGIYKNTIATDLRSDTLHLKNIELRLNFTDFASKKMQGEAILKVVSKKNGIAGIHLDLLKLQVDSVKVNTQIRPFFYNDSVLDISFATALNNADSCSLQIFYQGTPLQEAGDFGGFYWTATNAFNIGVSFLADPHNYGRVWFPCFDNFRERSFYEFYITTKDIHKAFCNGILQDVTSNGNTKIWHWKLSQDIPSYLASVAVAAYQTLYDTVQGINGVKEIQLAALASDTALLKSKFINLPAAFHIYENLWGAYQWDRVGFCIVPFNAGAMEHATNVSFMKALLTASFTDCEDVMAHELSHHWFGDLVTCDSASEMWLNEGWAVFNEMMFREKFYGLENAKENIRINHETVLHNAHLDDGDYLPVSGVPTEQTYGTTVYKKGSDVIHSLRTYMGDAQFFSCVKSYLTFYSGKTASTANMRDFLTQCSGINLSNYFSNWVYAPGFTHLSIDRIETLPSLTNGFVTSILIRQKKHHTPNFYTQVPVTISYFDANGNRTDEVVSVTDECTFHTSQLLLNEPVYVALDFDEKIQDAISDEWRTISTPATYDFGTAKLKLTVLENTDSSIVRVEHNWVRPEPMRTKIEGLHLHDKRYWTIDGLYNSNFKANARIEYNGNDLSLDNTFFTASEDSLVVMYRPNADTEWALADSFAIDVLVNANNKRGYAYIYTIKKGHYCLAIWNHAIIDTTTADVDCLFSEIKKIEPTIRDFQLYPNPSKDQASVTFKKGFFNTLELVDLIGNKLQILPIYAEQTSVLLNLKNIPAATYVVIMKGVSGKSASQVLIKQ